MGHNTSAAVMEWFSQVLDFFTHLDDHLADVISNYGTWTYLILFLIIFAETGLVFAPFLPGDSLLFVAGLLSHEHHGALNPIALFFVLTSAAIIGDSTNYFIGRTLGPRMFRKENARFFKRSHLDRTHAFFEKYGAKTVILARFVPIVRTFAPFVAGLGAMTYKRFLFYSILGSYLWVGVCAGAGYFFGGIPAVQDNFGLAILALVFLSILPAVFEVAKHKLSSKKAAPKTE